MPDIKKNENWIDCTYIIISTIYNAMSSSQFTIKDFNQAQAEKFARHQEQINKLKAEEEKVKAEEDRIKAEEERNKIEEIRLEKEAEMLEEMEYKEEFNNLLFSLDTFIVDIQSATNIMEIGMYVHCFKNVLENNIKFINDSNLTPEIAEKVTLMINNISQNENSYFDITNKDTNADVSRDIISNIKECLNIVNLDENSIDIQLMNTDQDEEIARKIQEENDNEYQFIETENNNQFMNFDYGSLPWRKRKRIHVNTRSPSSIFYDHPYRSISIPKQDSDQLVLDQENNFPDIDQVDSYQKTPDIVPSESIPFSTTCDRIADITKCDSDKVSMDKIPDDYFPDMDEVEDPELIQLMMYQSEFTQ